MSLMKKRDVPFPLYEVDLLSASDAELGQVSADMSLALSLDEMRTVRPESGDASRMLPRLYAPCSASLDLPWFPGPLNYSIAHPTPHCGGHGVSGDGCPSGIQGNEALTSGNSASGGIPRVLLGTI